MSQTETTAPGPETSEETRDWFFTFGYGQNLYVQHWSDVDAGRPLTGAGIPLDGYYVIINGTFRDARARMIKLFGATWCGQYSTLPFMDDIMGYNPWKELIKVPPRRAVGSLYS